jgi:hypothetical protein
MGSRTASTGWSLRPLGVECPAVRLTVARSDTGLSFSSVPNVLNVLGESRMNSRKMTSVALAAAAAMAFSMASITTASAADDGKVKCEGVNSCKGHSACKTANNSCKGQNSCKGKGFVEMTQAQCDAAKAKAGK